MFFKNLLKLLTQNFMDLKVLSSAGNYFRYLGHFNFSNIKKLSLKEDKTSAGTYNFS